MNTDPLIIASLIGKKFRGELTSQEADMLQAWAKSDPRNRQLLARLEEDVKAGIDTQIFEEFDSATSWSVVQKKRFRKRIQFWSRVAAVIAAVFTLSFFIFRTDKETISTSARIVESADSKFKNDVLPAIKGAKIIRADGTELKVDDNVRFLADGSIATDENKILEGTEVPVINTLLVPAANYLNLTLSDGTKVWVNASSKLEFPSRFGNKERKVFLKGEAYFEVSKDSERPFIVESKGAEVKVLGTHFNISAYGNKSITTLVEGQVEVSNGTDKQILLPGQRAEIGMLNIAVKRADLQKDLAWKNNIFYFKGDNIVQIAKQLETWYDLDISFSKGISFSQTYTGEISRNSNLSEVLKMLEFVSDLEFKIDKNKLLILNNKV